MNTRHPRTTRTWSYLSLLAIALANPVFAQQSPMAPRAEVRAETKAAQEQHRLLPAGEANVLPDAAETRSTKSRAQRKSEARQARKSSELLPAGDSAMRRSDHEEASSKSSRTRAQRKSEATAAAKAGELIPGGEAITPRNQ